MSTKLSEKQARFCQEYLIDLNATRAYKAVYGTKSDNSAAVSSNKLLRNPKITAFIQERQKQLQEKTGITQERVLQAYAAVAFSDIRKFYNEDGTLKKITDLDDDSSAAMAGMEIEELFEGSGMDRFQVGVTKKIKRWDKVKALDSLAKHLGMFEVDNKQKSQITVIDVVVQD
jgi:phage terminase small subunit